MTDADDAATVVVRAADGGPSVGSSSQISPRPIDLDWDGLESLRAREYGRLDALGETYLDYTGGGLYAESQLHAHRELLAGGLFGNPHSSSPASRSSTELADAARRAILAFVNASPEEYTVVFTANASAALKLVGEAFPFEPGSRYLMTTDNHNSVNGIRLFAEARGAQVTYLPLGVPDLRQDADEVMSALDRAPAGRRHLFAYPAQSNYSGVRHPLDWVARAQERGWDVLLDAAAFLPTNRLDLSRVRPDFVTVSWYKVFGYPTGLGSLIVRREALARLQRPWFGGGTIGVASVIVPRNTWADGEMGFEDGTIDYLGVPALEIGLDHLTAAGIDVIHDRVQFLTRHLLERLPTLRHPNGEPLVRLYGPADDVDRGGTIPFNVLDPAGRAVDFWKIEALAAERRISVRTGCFCNPGASETARGLTVAEMEAVFALGRLPDYEDLRRLLPGKALGAVRASLGIATTPRDVDRLLELIDGLAGRSPD